MSSSLCFLHYSTCILPVAAASIFAYILFVVEQNAPFTIMEDSVSYALAIYPNYYKPQSMLGLLVIASTFMYITTAIRNIQIRIWFRRQYGSYLQNCCCCCKKQPTIRATTCLAFTNDLASAVNILAYTAFLLLAVFPVGSDGWRNEVHNYAAITYFVLSTVYGGMQTALTWKQGDHYPVLFKYVQLSLVVGILGFFVTYAYTYLGTDDPIFVAEWIAVFGNLIFVAFFAIMFHVDSASDELVEFICPCCSTRDNRKGDETSSVDDNYQSI